MKASKIEFKGETRIKVEFPYNQAIASMLREISGARWSQTMKAWHIPYTKIAFTKLKQLFPEIEHPNKKQDIAAEVPVAEGPVIEVDGGHDQSKNVLVEVIGRKIIIKLPKNKLDVHFIASMRYSRWDGKQYCWNKVLRHCTKKRSKAKPRQSGFRALMLQIIGPVPTNMSTG